MVYEGGGGGRGVEGGVTHSSLRCGVLQTHKCVNQRLFVTRKKRCYTLSVQMFVLEQKQRREGKQFTHSLV